MKIVKWLVALFPSLAIAAAPAPLELQSEAFQAIGTKQEILSRARTCVAKLVRFDPIQVNTASVSELATGAATERERRTDIAGGPVIVDANPDTGTLVANNRTPGKFMRSTFYIDSQITLEARDGKFRVTHSKIRTDGAEPIEEMRGLIKPATEALVNQTRAIATCVISPPTDDF